MSTSAAATAHSRRGRRGARLSRRLQSRAICQPRIAKYVYRSAIDWKPTCTSPIMGSNIPTNQRHPTAIHGCVRRNFQATRMVAPTQTTAATSTGTGHQMGCA